MTRAQVQVGRRVRFEPKATGSESESRTYTARTAAPRYAGMDSYGWIYDGKIRRQRERDGTVTEVTRVRFDGDGFRNYVWVRLDDLV